MIWGDKMSIKEQIKIIIENEGSNKLFIKFLCILAVHKNKQAFNDLWEEYKIDENKRRPLQVIKHIQSDERWIDRIINALGIANIERILNDRKAYLGKFVESIQIFNEYKEFLEKEKIEKSKKYLKFLLEKEFFNEFE